MERSFPASLQHKNLGKRPYREMERSSPESLKHKRPEVEMYMKKYIRRLPKEMHNTRHVMHKSIPWPEPEKLVHGPTGWGPRSLMESKIGEQIRCAFGHCQQTRESRGFEVHDSPVYDAVVPLSNPDKNSQFYLFLSRMATEALNHFNSLKGTSYGFHRTVRVNSSVAGGIIYYLTFEAMDPRAGYAVQTFETMIFDRGHLGAEIMSCNIIRPSRGAVVSRKMERSFPPSLKYKNLGKRPYGEMERSSPESLKHKRLDKRPYMVTPDVEMYMKKYIRRLPKEMHNTRHVLHKSIPWPEPEELVHGPTGWGPRSLMESKIGEKIRYAFGPREFMKADYYTDSSSCLVKHDPVVWGRHCQQTRESRGFEVHDSPVYDAVVPLRNPDKNSQFYLFLSRMATEALNHFNSLKGTSYGFHRTVRVNSSVAGGVIYYLTFEAMDPRAGYAVQTFETMIFDRVHLGAEIMSCNIIRPSRGVVV